MAHPKRPVPREQFVESLHQERTIAAALLEQQEASAEAGLDSLTERQREASRLDWGG
jgi:hypothetical protein